MLEAQFYLFFIPVLLFAKSSTVKIFHSVDLLFLRIPTLFPISCICRNFSSHTWSLENISATETLFCKFFCHKTLWWSLFCHSGFVSDAGKILHMQRFVQRCPRKTMRQVFSAKDHKLTEKTISIKFWMGGSGKGRGKQVTVGKFDFEWYVYKQSGTGAAAWELRRYLLHLYKAVGVLAILRLVAKKTSTNIFFETSERPERTLIYPI